MSIEVKIEDIAKVCHETNRAYCASIGDNSQPPWEEAPKWQRDSAVLGVRFHLSGERAQADSHKSWMEQKRAEGWSYGPVKHEGRKEHPCYVPYDQLPDTQKAKDFLFKSVVDGYKGILGSITIVG